MTTFGNATTALARSYARAEAGLQAKLDAAYDAADRAFEEIGPNWQEMEEATEDPERFVSEADYFAPTGQDRADLDTVLAWEAFGGFHNP